MYIRFYSKENNYYASASKLLYNITKCKYNTAKDARYFAYYIPRNRCHKKIKLSHIFYARKESRRLPSETSSI